MWNHVSSFKGLRIDIEPLFPLMNSNIISRLVNGVSGLSSAILNFKFREMKSILIILNSLILIWLFLSISTSATTPNTYLASFLPDGFNYYIFQLGQIIGTLLGLYFILKNYTTGLILFALFSIINSILMLIATILFIGSDPSNLNLDCSRSNSLLSSPAISSSIHSNSISTPSLNDRDACIQNAVFIIKLHLSVGLLLSLTSMFSILSYVLKGISIGSFEDENDEHERYYVCRTLNPWDTIEEPLPSYQPKDDFEIGPPIYFERMSLSIIAGAPNVIPFDLDDHVRM